MNVRDAVDLGVEARIATDVVDHRALPLRATQLARLVDGGSRSPTTAFSRSVSVAAKTSSSRSASYSISESASAWVRVFRRSRTIAQDLGKLEGGREGSRELDDGSELVKLLVDGPGTRRSGGLSRPGGVMEEIPARVPWR